MVEILVKESEFMDEGYPYIKQIFDSGRKHIKQKPGVDYPIKPREETPKEAYAKLTTANARINFLAKLMGLE